MYSQNPNIQTIINKSDFEFEIDGLTNGEFIYNMANTNNFYDDYNIETCNIFGIEQNIEIEPIKEKDIPTKSKAKIVKLDERLTYEKALQDFLNEYMALAKNTADYTTPREIGNAFCESCDPLFKNWHSQGTFAKAKIFMQKQLKFIPDEHTLNNENKYLGGKYYYNRDFKGIFKFFPDNYEEARNTTKRISDRFFEKTILCKRIKL